MRKDPPSWAIVNYMVKLRMDWVACFLVTKQKDDYDNNNKKKVDIFEFSTKHYCMKKYLKLTVHSTNVESFQDISRLLISRIPRVTNSSDYNCYNNHEGVLGKVRMCAAARKVCGLRAVDKQLLNVTMGID